MMRLGGVVGSEATYTTPPNNQEEAGIKSSSHYREMSISTCTNNTTNYAETAEFEEEYADSNAAGNGSSNHVVGESTRTEQPSEHWTAYFHSPDMRELVASTIFLVLSSVIYWVDPYPHERPIPYQYLDNSGDYVRNLVYNEIHTSETVNDTMLLVIAEIIPVVLQFLVSYLWGRRGDCHKTLCVYFVAIGLCLFVTECIKLYVGYLRPYFFQACEPDDTYETCTVDSTANVRKSFVSGHASTAFCGLMVLTLYFHNRFGIPSVTVHKQEFLDETTFRWTVAHSGARHPMLYRFVSLASLAPLAVAVFIAASRLVDNKHFPADVVGGSVLGAAIALFVNSLWFQ